MRFEFTLRTPGGDHDVAVDSTRAITLRDLRPALLASVDAPPGSAFDLGPETALGSRDWQTGAVLHLGSLPRAPARPRADTLSIEVTGGRDAGLVVPLGSGRTVIGRGAHCGVVLDDDGVSREHADLIVHGSGVTINDRGSTNGTSVEGRRSDSHEVNVGETVRVGDTTFTVRVGDRPAISGEHDDPLVIDIAGDPAKAPAHMTRWPAVALPALAGGGVALVGALVTHSPSFLLFALLSPVVLVATALSDRWGARRTRRISGRALSRRRAADDDLVATALRHETRSRRARFPDAAVVAAVAAGRDDGLWRRRHDHPDILRLRLGSADQPSWTQVRHDGQTRPAGRIVSAPLVVDLRTGPLGLAGPPGVVRALARWLVIQLAVLHSPVDVRLALCFVDPRSAQHWSWARWLPHLNDLVADDLVADDLVADDAATRRTMRDDLSHADSSTVLLIDTIAGRPGATTFTGDPSTGCAIVVADTAAGLPSWCARVIDLARPGEFCAGPDRPVIDQLHRDRAEAIARTLAPLEVPVKAGSTAPRSCDLLETLGLDGPTAAEVRERWAADDGRAQTVIGVVSGASVTIDLDRDGPHVLVAGTTGSGKSELLRSFVLGLALLHPPEAITFVLIDFKGGATFASCTTLPHVVGSVTDLDQHLATRALLSLEAELRRRERLFAAAGAGDLAGFRRGVGARERAIARLVIVIDEFATLADELPDVLRGVVSVAQRGRSLGVHLVLATQRPGAAVTPEVRANTSLRIALRVVDPGESHEIVGVDDAAAIAPNIPGRAVLSSGNGPLLFQTAAIGQQRDRRHGEPIVERLGPWRRRPRPAVPHRADDECGRVVEIVQAAANGHGTPRGPWLPPLRDLIAASALEAGGLPHRIPFAVLDLPAEQRQPVLDIDLDDESSWLLVGDRGSGCTTALASIAFGAAAALEPAAIEIYVLDGAGRLIERLQKLPHVATALGPNDLHLAETLLRRLSEREPGSARVLVLIDHGERVLLGDGDVPMPWAVGSGALLRPGSATVVVAGSPTLTSSRAVSGIEHRVLMRLPDRRDYMLAGLAARDVPTTLPPGRAVRVADGALLQIAVRDDGHHLDGPRSPTAVRLRRLPTQIALDDLPLDPDRAATLRLGLVGDSAECLSIDPFVGSRRWLVAGPPRSGRTTLLCTLLLEAHRTDTHVVVAAASESVLHEHATYLGVSTLVPSASYNAEFLADQSSPALVLVDDLDAFAETALGDRLAELARSDDNVSFVVAGRSDDLATAHQGLAPIIRRSRSGVLLRPGPLDAEMFGTRLRRVDPGPPGRGVVIGEPAWTAGSSGSEASIPLAIQVAHP